MKKNNLTYLIFGFVIGLILIAISVYLMAGGHGNYNFANKAFPFSMLIATVNKEIGIIPIILSFIQYPLYFWLIFVQKTMTKEIIALSIIVVIHFIAITAFKYIDSNQF